MSMTAEEARRKLKAAQAREALRLAQQGDVPESESGRGVIESLADVISRPFNKGLTAIPELFPGGDALRQSTDYFGLTSPEEQEAEGIIPRGMEFLGGAVLPGGAIQAAGRNVLKQAVPLVQQSVPQFIASQTAARPGATLGADVIGSFSGAAGGEVAKQYTDDPGTIATAELATGLGLPALVSGAPRAASAIAEKLPISGTAIRAGKSLKESFNTADRQIKRLQEMQADPQAGAAKIETKSPVSPARQTEEPRAVALEEQILREAPADVAKAHELKVRRANEEAVRGATDFPGDADVPRTVIQAQANKVLDDADAAIAQIDSGASPRDISRVQRENLESSLQAARKDETKIWQQIDQDAPAKAGKTAKAMADLEAAESDITLRDIVPREVKALLAKYDASLDSGDVEFTLKDLQSVRSSIGDQIRRLRADGEWNKARILGKFHASLLDDMTEVDAAGIEKAREFSRSLNEKFTKGEVGKILKLSKTGVKEVDDPETLSKLLSGESVTRGIQQFEAANPGSRDSIAEFIQNRYVIQATNPDGSLNQSTSKRVIDRLRSQGVFEEFPEMEAQLANVASKSSRADILRKRGGARLEHDSNEALASTFLNQPVGKETDLLFSAKNPVQSARRLVSAMGGDANAEKGLRRSFAEGLLRQAETSKLDDVTGNPIYSGAKYTRLINDNEAVLKALGFSKDQLTILRRSATILRQNQIKSEKGVVKASMEDAPAWFLRDPARIAGARVGGELGKSTSGSSIQIANIMANRFQTVLDALTVDRAKSGLIDMLDNKALYKAFLLGEKAPKVEKEKAIKALETWVYGLGANVASEQAQEQSQP